MLECASYPDMPSSMLSTTGTRISLLHCRIAPSLLLRGRFSATPNGPRRSMVCCWPSAAYWRGCDTVKTVSQHTVFVNPNSPGIRGRTSSPSTMGIPNISARAVATEDFPQPAGPMMTNICFVFMLVKMSVAAIFQNPVPRTGRLLTSQHSQSNISLSNQQYFTSFIRLVCSAFTAVH